MKKEMQWIERKEPITADQNEKKQTPHGKEKRRMPCGQEKALASRGRKLRLMCAVCSFVLAVSLAGSCRPFSENNPGQETRAKEASAAEGEPGALPDVEGSADAPGPAPDAKGSADAPGPAPPAKETADAPAAVPGTEAAEGASGAASGGIPDAPATMPATETPHTHGEGFFAAGDTGLSGEQQKLLLSFLNLYYESLSALAPADPSGYFADPAGIQAVINRVAWEYQIALRQMQRADLSLLHYTYELTVQSAEEQENGEILVVLTENNCQNFACSPGVDSESSGVYHRFALVSTENGWRLNEHMQWDGMYWAVMRPIFTEDPLEPEEAIHIVEEQKGLLLQQARQLLTARREQKPEQETLDCGHPYDRAAAVDYARQWALSRNPEWADYSGSGGNCQNFVSQCLLAGGIPMDTTGGAVWKWYGRSPNNRAGASGRSASWTGVEGFLSYVRGNEGGAGLAAVADAPYYGGRAGDVIHMGYGEDEGWSHTVLITEVLTDEAGNIVDYLVCSNTADQRDFPVGAYALTRQMLIRIEGWND